MVPDADFPVGTFDAWSNASGLVLGTTQYCDPSGVAPVSECEFTENSGTYEIEIEDFDSCGISSVYKSSEDYVSTN